VHPFDDPDVVAGQGSLGLELLEDVPDLARIVIPVGGGGLCAGVAIAVKSARPEVQVIGVQVGGVRALPRVARARRAVPATSALTIADGSRSSARRAARCRCCAAGSTASVVWRGRDAEAMVVLMERCKLVVEGAGAVGVAALLGGQVAPPPTARRSRSCPAATSTRACWRRSRAATRPRPAAGWCCSRACPTGPARSRPARLRRRPGANIVDVSHVREGLDLHVRETASSWCSRRAGTSTPTRCSASCRARGYDTRVIR
jgi:threonine dehydratase